MSGRVTGYHYVTDKQGKRHRVYSNPPGKAVKGRGAYSMGKSVSRARALRGRGGYYDSGFVKTMNKYVPKGSFANAGAVVAGPLGRALGSMASKLAGFGAYSLKANSILSEGQSPPNMHSNDSSLKVRHREYICDIVSSGTANTFKLDSFPIQPGLPTAFPWLSAIASQYEEHKPLGIVYEFKTLSADAISSSQANMSIGGIIMATDYNSINPPFVNKQQMDNTEYTTSDKPSCSFYHPVECDPRQNPLSSFYVRSGAAPAGTDLRMYDLGLFQIASFGIAATSVVLGELWVTYEWEFKKPISTNALGQDVLSDHFQLGTISTSNPLGTTSVIAPNSSIGGTITGGNKYSFNPLVQEGNYLMVYQVTGTAAAINSPLVGISGTNCQTLSMWNNDNNFTAVQNTNGGGAATIVFISAIWKITGPGASITFTAPGSYPGGTLTGDLFLTQIDSDLTQ